MARKRQREGRDGNATWVLYSLGHRWRNVEISAVKKSTVLRRSVLDI